MHSFEAIEASILLGIILITITVRNRARFKRRRNYSRRTLATALVSSMLLVGMFFAGVQSVNGALPTYASNSDASFNATEYVTGENTTTETYTTKNNFNNLQRKTSFTAISPQNFSLQGDITITVKNIIAEEDSREIEGIEGLKLDQFQYSDTWYEVSSSFNITSAMANISEIRVVYSTVNPTPKTLNGTIAIFNVDANLRPTTMVPGSLKNLTTDVGVDWQIVTYTPAINLSRGSYAVVLSETSPTLGNDDRYLWYYWLDSENGNNASVYSHIEGQGWGAAVLQAVDLPLRLEVLPVDPSNISNAASYSSADQVDMRVNDTAVGGDNSVSFSFSSGVFVFTTNNSVVFQKNWTALFMRNFSVSSSHKVVNDFVVWNLSYSLENVTEGSANTYSDRGVNITSIPSSWSVDSANPWNAVKYDNTIVVSLSDNNAYLNAFVICNSPKANIDFVSKEYNATHGEKVPILFRFYYMGKNLSANNVMINETVNGTSFFFECHYMENGWHNITYYTASLDAGNFVLVIQAYNSEYGALGQEEVVLHIKNQVIVGSQEGFVDQLLDYLPYVVLLILGAFGSIAVARNYYARKQEWLDRQKIHRIMVVWEVFAFYDQTPSEVVAEGSLADKDLVSGLFTAIKDIVKDVGGATLETMKVYPNHPYYFVYTGTFYCVLILSDRPSLRLEEKLILFARVVEEKYRRVFEEKYGESFFSGWGVPETRLDLDREVMRIFGLIPITSLQTIVAVSLSYEDIDKLKVRDDVKKVLMTGRASTDKLGKLPLEKFIQVATNSLGDIKRAHSAVLKVLKLGLITIVEKPTIPKEKPTVLEIKPEPESVKKVEEEKKEIRGRGKKEFFEKYYESALSFEEIDPKKDIGKDERIVLKYVRSYNDQVGLGIKGVTMIEGLKKEFKGDEKKAINALKKTLKTGFLSEKSDLKP